MKISSEKYFISELEKVKSEQQQKFLKKLVPTIDEKNILGVKNPQIRNIAKLNFKSNYDLCMEYINILPHKYLEEYILHEAILEQIKDYDVVIKNTNKLLPYIDNWATCDTFSPKIFLKYLDKSYQQILKWIQSKKTYTIRFGIEMFMSFYLNKQNYKNFLNLAYDDVVTNTSNIISKIRFKSKYKFVKESQTECPDKYYVDMMIAWYFATFLAKDFNIALPYIKNHCLENWIHKMTIRKACESYRISDKEKLLLKKLV